MATEEAQNDLIRQLEELQRDLSTAEASLPTSLPTTVKDDTKDDAGQDILEGAEKDIEKAEALLSILESQMGGFNSKLDDMLSILQERNGDE